MEFDDFDFDLSVLDDEQVSTKNSDEDDAKLKLLKQLLRGSNNSFDDKLAELQSLLYGELLSMLGEYDPLNIYQHHKLIKQLLLEITTASLIPTFAAISEDILSVHHEFSNNDAKKMLIQLKVSKYLDLALSQNAGFCTLFSNLVCYVGQSDSWQVNIVNREGQATDISSIDSDILYSLFNEQIRGAGALHQLFTLQIGIPQWSYDSAIIKFIPVVQAELSSPIYTLTGQQIIEELNKFHSTDPNSIPNHPNTLMQAVINRLQAQVTQTENACRQDIGLFTQSLLNDDNLSDADSKALNTLVNIKKQQLTKLQNLSNSLPSLKGNLTATVNQLIKMVNLPMVESNLPNDILWLSLLMETNNLDKILEKATDDFFDTGAFESFDTISFMGEQGHADAQYILGNCYHFGQGIAEDKSKAVEWYQKAAEQGNSNAQFYLGDCFFYGNGVAEDKSKAVEWYRKAAEQGHTGAQCYLGLFYDNGIGVEENKSKAVEWYQKAAEQGNSSAQFYLGDCFFYGNGVAEDKSKAVEWYRKAAEQGHSNAQYSLGNCYFDGDGIKENKAKGVTWYQRAAEQGHSKAQHNLGNCYFTGDGTKENKEKVVEWHRKAAEQGLAESQFNLGACYFSGYGVKEDKAKGIIWFQRAAEQGHAGAQYNLGNCFFTGDGTKEDKENAVEWHRKAAEQGLAESQYNLGFCYEYGEGVGVDINKAIELYQKAAQQGQQNAIQKVKHL